MADWWGMMLSSWHPAWQPLFQAQSPLTQMPVTTLFDSPLPRGWYVFLFNVDDTPDGVFQPGWYDYVVVLVTSAGGDQLEELPDFRSLVEKKMRE